MKQVWIVWGASGEYDDYRDWIVKIFDNQTAAEACAAAARDWVRKNRGALKDMSFEERELVKNPYDDSFTPWGSDDTEYTVVGPAEVKSEFVPVA